MIGLSAVALIAFGQYEAGDAAAMRPWLLALMCLYLGAAVFWAIAAFTPSWQRTAVIWGIFFAFSLAIGRVLSLIVDGRPSLLLLVYLGLEIAGGVLGLGILMAADRKIRR